MDRNDAVVWLNKRAKLSGPVIHIDNDDITFIRNYIHHYKKELVDPAKIAKSISSLFPGEFLHYIDSMATILINDFDIKTKTEKRKIQDPQINISMGKHPFAQQDLDFIVEYE